RHIRETDPTAQILLLSARGETQDRVLGIEFGADDYLAKPFDPRELVARVGAMARRSGAAPQSEASMEIAMMDDLKLEPATLRAWRGDTRIDLTAREVDLLVLLHQNAGRALSRDEIFDVCWGRGHLPESRALDQYVSALRRKIEHDPAAPRIISTVRGVGYRYDPSD
ncbi:MAG: response regulator transcription factor, partial [Pseudomonadota bacterium]